SPGHNDLCREAHQLCCKRREPIGFSVCRSPLNDDVFPLDVAEITQSLAERLHAGCVSGKGGSIEISNARKFHWLLRLHGNAKRKEQSAEPKGNNFLLHLLLLFFIFNFTLRL